MKEHLELDEVHSWLADGLKFVVIKFDDELMTLIPFRTLPGAEFYLFALKGYSVKIVETASVIDLFQRLAPIKGFKEDAQFACGLN